MPQLVSFNSLTTINKHKTILDTNIMLVQNKRSRSTYTIFDEKPIKTCSPSAWEFLISSFC